VKNSKTKMEGQQYSSEQLKQMQQMQRGEQNREKQQQAQDTRDSMCHAFMTREAQER